MNILTPFARVGCTALLFVFCALSADAEAAVSIGSVTVHDGTLTIACTGRPSENTYDFSRDGTNYFVVAFPGAVLFGSPRELSVSGRLALRADVTQFTLHPDVVHVVLEGSGSEKFFVATRRDGGESYLVTVSSATTARLKVFLDVGHGGYDPGGTGPDGLPESFVNMAVAKRLSGILRDEGIGVALDRTGNRYVSLPDRVALADESGSDLFVGLYCNASRDANIRGVTTYYYHPGARAFARYLEDHIARATGLSDDGIAKDDLYVIMHTTPRMPDVLVEYGYISNPAEEHLLAETAFRDRIASAIAEAITSYFPGATEGGGVGRTASEGGEGEQPKTVTITSVFAKDGMLQVRTRGRPSVDSFAFGRDGKDFFVITFDNCILSGPRQSLRLGPPFSASALITQYSVSPETVRIALSEDYLQRFVASTDALGQGDYITKICPSED